MNEFETRYFEERRQDRLALIDSLKPCPLCGSRAIFTIVKGKKHKGVCVECEECGARGPIQESKLISYFRPSGKNGWESTLEEAISAYGYEAAEKWNRRICNE